MPHVLYSPILTNTIWADCIRISPCIVSGCAVRSASLVGRAHQIPAHNVDLAVSGEELQLPCMPRAKGGSICLLVDLCYRTLSNLEEKCESSGTH